MRRGREEKKRIRRGGDGANISTEDRFSRKGGRKEREQGKSKKRRKEGRRRRRSGGGGCDGGQTKVEL